jgi:hypothetical protein
MNSHKMKYGLLTFLFVNILGAVLVLVLVLVLGLLETQDSYLET